MNQNNKQAMDNKIGSLLRQDSGNNFYLPSLNHQSGYQSNGNETNNSLSSNDDMLNLLANQNVNQSANQKEYSTSDDNQASVSEKSSEKGSIDEGNIIGNIILLPNNFLSDDELSSNSDDCVYAYRGADFDPVHVSHDDETDYLEMDFEPDPASEIEQEPHPLGHHLPNDHELVAASPFDHDDKQPLPDLFSKDVNAAIQLDELRAKFDETNWCNAIDAPATKEDDANNDKIVECCNGISNQRETNENARSKSIESNNIQFDKETSHENSQATQPIGYYDKTISLCPKKYTGTIPKTNRFQIRSTKTKSSTAVNSIKSTHESHSLGSSVSNDQSNVPFNSQSNTYNQTCKRWKISKDASNGTTVSGDGNLHEVLRLNQFASTSRLPATTSRSMSVPCDEFLFSHNGDCEQTASNCSYENDVYLHATRSQNSLCCDNDIRTELSIDDEKTADDGSTYGNSVTFSSINCTVDKILDALVS